VIGYFCATGLPLIYLSYAWMNVDKTIHQLPFTGIDLFVGTVPYHVNRSLR
jgi:hypothetical protein